MSAELNRLTHLTGGYGPRRHPSVYAVLKHFRYDHLPPHLQAISRPLGDLAAQMADNLPEGSDLVEGLRRLLEAKDNFVRAAVGMMTNEPGPRTLTVVTDVSFKDGSDALDVTTSEIPLPL